MNPVLARNGFFVKEHVGLFKAANNFDIHDPESEVSLAIREEGGYALMPEWGTHPANHYLPRRKTKLKIHKDELERADNPLKVDGQLPKPSKGDSSMDDVSAW